MPAGQLRHRVRFERQGAGVDDGYGNEIEGWAAIDTVPAEIRPMKGSEQVLASKLQGVTPVEITIRWTAAFGEGAGRLTPNDRAVNARTGEIYNMRSVEDREMRRQWLNITADGGGVAT